MMLVATVALLAVLFAGGQEDPLAKARAQRLDCIRNLKQIGLAMRIWCNDNKDVFPMKVKAAGGGSLEAGATGEAFRHFAAVSKELSRPGVLVCPSDDRKAAANFSELANTNIGYFIGLDADETKPQMLLAGDRNLTNGLPRKKGVVEVSAGNPAGWTAEIHGEVGNLGLSDGSAQQVTEAGLRRQIEAHRVGEKPAVQRLQFPD